MVRRRHLPGKRYRGIIQRSRRRISLGSKVLAVTRQYGILSDAMNDVKRRLVLSVSILSLLGLCSCQLGSADSEPMSAGTVIHPVEITAVRWLADRTVGSLEEGGTSSCRCSEPNAIARQLPEEPSADCAAICLSARGFLIAQMSATFTDGSDADLLVYEIGSQRGGTDDRFSVYVSENGYEWIQVGEAIANDPEQARASIDLGDLRGDYLYVKIVPAAAGIGITGGVEILAIEALHPSVEFGL